MSGGEADVQTEVYLSKQPGLGHTPYSAIPPPELTRVNGLMWGDRHEGSNRRRKVRGDGGVFEASEQEITRGLEGGVDKNVTI